MKTEIEKSLAKFFDNEGSLCRHCQNETAICVPCGVINNYENFKPKSYVEDLIEELEKLMENENE